MRSPHCNQNTLSTYNGIGVVTIEGMITGPPDVRDTYINLRVNADRLTTPDRSSHPIEGVVLVRPLRPAEFRYEDRVRVTGPLTAAARIRHLLLRRFPRAVRCVLADRPQV